MIRVPLEYMVLIKKLMKVYLCQKYSFQNNSNECENRELSVTHFRSNTKARSRCVSKLLRE